MVTKDGRNTLGRISSSDAIKVIDGKDGHVYYLINADGNKGVCNTVFLGTYNALRQQTNRSGLFFVADATDDPSGTVHQGWAVYIWDELHGKWIKIAEQETVEGVWGIDEELLSKYLLKATFNAFKNDEFSPYCISTNNAIVSIKTRLDTAEENIVILLARSHHDHDNKAILDALSAKFGDIYYNDQRLGGNSYLYKQTPIDGQLVWVDPTYTGTTPFTPVVCRNSQEIADKFAKTSLAYAGLSFIIRELDGSVTTFRINRTTNFELSDYKSIFSIQGNQSGDDPYATTGPFTVDDYRTFVFCTATGTPTSLSDFTAATNRTPTGTLASMGSLTPIQQANALWLDHWYEANGLALAFDGGSMYFAEPKYIAVYENTSLTNASGETLTSGTVNSVEKLPTATLALVHRGLFCPRIYDGTHPADHLYRCNEHQVEGVWTAYWEDVTVGDLAATYTGANITSCWMEDHTMWKKARITWTDPDTTITLTNGQTYEFGDTVLVRKFGSAPTHVGDGQVVCTATHDQYKTSPFIDWLPFSEEKVYYRVFSKLTTGQYLTVGTASSAECNLMTWEYIQTVLNQSKGTLVFSVGDILVLPEHATYGEIECEITKVGATFLEVSSVDVICKKAIDAVEDAYVKTTDTSVDTNKQYVRRIIDSTTGAVSYANYDGTPSAAELTALYEPNTGDASRLNSDGTVIGGALHGSTNFLQSNLYQWLNATTDNWFVKKTTWDTAPSYANEKGFVGGFGASALTGALANVVFTIPNDATSHTQAKHLDRSIATVDWHLNTLNTDGDKFVSGLTTGGTDVYPETEIGVVLHFVLGTVPTTTT